MKKYRKKPLIIEAVQWLGQQEINIPEMTHGVIYGEGNKSALIIKTLEGEMVAGYGDWIIKGIKGEFYPCKPDIFEASYEVIDELTRQT